MKHMKLTRRDVLAAGAGLALAACHPVLAEDTAKSEKKPKGFKLGVCDWTLGKRTDPAALEIAGSIGLDGVQVDFGSGEHDLPLFDPELQKRYQAAVKTGKAAIASLAMGVLNNIAYKNDARAEKWVDQAIDVAKAMKQKIILLAFFGNGDLKNDVEGTKNAIARLKNIAPKAEKAGVTLAVESWLNAAEHLDIIDRVGSPAIKVYYDVGNSHKMGYDIYQEIRTLGKQICQFHAKDYEALYGKGSIDFPRVREAMDAIGYRDWFVMEGVKMPLGVEDSCRYDAEYLRPIFSPKVG